MALIVVLSMLIGLFVGSFLTFQLLVSYDEAESYLDVDYDDIEAALPSKASQYDTAVVKDEPPKRLVGDTDEIRAIFAKRRGGGRD